MCERWDLIISSLQARSTGLGEGPRVLVIWVNSKPVCMACFGSRVSLAKVYPEGDNFRVVEVEDVNFCDKLIATALLIFAAHIVCAFIVVCLLLDKCIY